MCIILHFKLTKNKNIKKIKKYEKNYGKVSTKIDCSLSSENSGGARGDTGADPSSAAENKLSVELEAEIEIGEYDESGDGVMLRGERLGGVADPCPSWREVGGGDGGRTEGGRGYTAPMVVFCTATAVVVTFTFGTWAPPEGELWTCGAVLGGGVEDDGGGVVDCGGVEDEGGGGLEGGGV